MKTLLHAYIDSYHWSSGLSFATQRSHCYGNIRAPIFSCLRPYLLLCPLPRFLLNHCFVPLTHTYALVPAYPPIVSQHTLSCTRVALPSIFTDAPYTSLLLLTATLSRTCLSRLPCALTITSYLVCAPVSLRIKPVVYLSVFLNLNLTCILSETCLFLSKPLLLKSIPVPCRCHAPSHFEPLALRAKVPLTLHTKPSILRRADEPSATSAIYDLVSY